MKFGFGQSVGRVEDRRLITGLSWYTDDLDPGAGLCKAGDKPGRLVHPTR